MLCRHPHLGPPLASFWNYNILSFAPGLKYGNILSALLFYFHDGHYGLCGKVICSNLRYNRAIMVEQLDLRGTLKGHKGWVTQIATTPQNPDAILSSSRGTYEAGKGSFRVTWILWWSLALWLFRSCNTFRQYIQWLLVLPFDLEKIWSWFCDGYTYILSILWVASPRRF